MQGFMEACQENESLQRTTDPEVPRILFFPDNIYHPAVLKGKGLFHMEAIRKSYIFLDQTVLSCQDHDDGAVNCNPVSRLKKALHEFILFINCPVVHIRHLGDYLVKEVVMPEVKEITVDEIYSHVCPVCVFPSARYCMAIYIGSIYIAGAYCLITLYEKSSDSAEGINNLRIFS